MKERLVKVLLVAPKKHPAIVYMPAETICDIIVSTSEDCMGTQASKIAYDIYIIHSREGVLFNLQGNRRFQNKIIIGLFFVVGADEQGRIRSLSEVEIAGYESLFWEPEEFRYDELLSAYYADKFEEFDEFV